MAETVLITGGAGFIGSHLADRLVGEGMRVRVLDSLSPQVHGPGAVRPDYLHPGVELMVGDVRDPDAVQRALEGVRTVFHFAAAVGVGQSMYEIDHYTSVNNRGTAVLLERIIASGKVERLVVASSMSIYGEGCYRDKGGDIRHGVERPLEQLKAGRWELSAEDGEELEPAATPEGKQPSLSSVYALSKFDQERMCLMIGRAYGFPVTALRFFNVFGTRQSLSNPYTGVLAIFASRLLNGNAPRIFEDGLQQRDFVHVTDVARACRLAMESPEAAGKVFNVGSGRNVTVLELARRLARLVQREHLEPEITGCYRAGDIRHCFADISLARQVLGYQPEVTLEAGLAELAGWLEGRMAADMVAQAHAELAARGLTI